MIRALKHKIMNFLKRWIDEAEALATVEAALVFPILMTILLGTFDMGNAILSNQKAIRASQVVADLVTRNMTISAAELEEAIKAGELAFAPLDSSTFGVDIVSVHFNEEAASEILWRETRNMTADADILETVVALAEADNGVVIVTTRYVFEPIFGGFIIDQIPMQERAFARGRESTVVTLE